MAAHLRRKSLWYYDMLLCAELVLRFWPDSIIISHICLLFIKAKESYTMRVTFYTLGCKVNQNETGALAQLFEENGYTVVFQ